MSTNFYLRNNKYGKPCDKCGHVGEQQLHIGLSSYGRCFCLHVIPELGLNTLDDWDKLFSEPDSKIFNEYNEEISRVHMNSIIRERSCAPIRDVELLGYQDLASFYRWNNAEMGPNNLLRRKIDHRCIGHGEGTWDLFVGEFS